MNKKSLLMMMVTICLIAVVGVGATLAYLSDATTVMTNTFTVGKGITVRQDEKNLDTTIDKERTDTGNTYANFLPGETREKDPTAYVGAGSPDCYVFMELAGADALTAKQFTFNGFNANEWIKVTNIGKLDGVYRYYEVVKQSDTETRLKPLFASVTYSLNATETEKTFEPVTIRTCAVQEAEMDETTALNAAVEVMSK